MRLCGIVDTENVLGSGEFGLVLKGTYGGQDVAVKTLKPESTKGDLKSLLSEVKVLVYTGKHENIVQLIGAVTKYLRVGKNYIGFYGLHWNVFDVTLGD